MLSVTGEICESGPQPTLPRWKRVVVKVGSGVIAAGGQFDPQTIADIAGQVHAARQAGHEIVMVVSGAVAAGFRSLRLSKPPTTVVGRQAAASIGQYRLMVAFADAFERHQTEVAQLLLTEEDIENRRRFISARHTMQTLIERRVVPIINENDPLADDDIKIGDNDLLAALVTNMVTADLLVILSSVDGIYRNGQAGSIIEHVEVGSSIEEHITTALSETGVGGMAAKVSAAKLASNWGVPTVIANGTIPDMLGRVLKGEQIGTTFQPRKSKISSRKRWIAFRTKSRGSLRVDAGAKKAISMRGAALLPAGILDVQGQFAMGARVDIQDEAGTTFAVGLVSYTADEIRRMRGKSRTEFRKVLGYEYVDEIINRDDMVLMDVLEAREIDA